MNYDRNYDWKAICANSCANSCANASAATPLTGVKVLASSLFHTSSLPVHYLLCLPETSHPPTLCSSVIPALPSHSFFSHLIYSMFYSNCSVRPLQPWRRPDPQRELTHTDAVKTPSTEHLVYPRLLIVKTCVFSREFSHVASLKRHVIRLSRPTHVSHPLTRSLFFPPWVPTSLPSVHFTAASLSSTVKKQVQRRTKNVSTHNHPTPQTNSNITF